MLQKTVKVKSHTTTLILLASLYFCNRISAISLKYSLTDFCNNSQDSIVNTEYVINTENITLQFEPNINRNFASPVVTVTKIATQNTSLAYLCNYGDNIYPSCTTNILLPLNNLLYEQKPNIIILATYKIPGQNTKKISVVYEDMQTLWEEYSLAEYATKVLFFPLCKQNQKLLSFAESLERELNYLSFLIKYTDRTKINYFVIINKKTLSKEAIKISLEKFKRKNLRGQITLLSLDNIGMENPALPYFEQYFLLVDTAEESFTSLQFFNQRTSIASRN